MNGAPGDRLNVHRRISDLTAFLANNPGALRAMLRWPVFSVASYEVVTRLRRANVAPATVLDVGANLGQFAVAAARLFGGPRVHAFEPLPDCVRSLRKNVAQLTGISVHDCALGQEDGTFEIRLTSDDRASSFLALGEGHRSAFPTVREERKVEVKMRRLDGVWRELNPQPPVLLKLDVQGFERAVLEGGREVLPDVNWLVAEVSFEPMYEGESSFRDLLSWLEAEGFRFVRPVGWLTSQASGAIVQMDALFARQATAPREPQRETP